MIHVQQIVNKVLSSNTFVVSCDRSHDIWLVDVGDFDAILHILPACSVIRGVFLTHTHFDHIYGINELANQYPECIVYTSEYGKDALYSAKKNFSYYHDNPIVYSGEQVQILSEGDAIDIYPSVQLKVFSTPGHCPSCLTFQVEDKIFTGDSYLPNYKVVSKLPLGDKAKAKESENRIIELSQSLVIFPGHGPICLKR